MQAGIGYDTTKFYALRHALRALNEGALADGLVAARDGGVVDPISDRRRARRVAREAKAAKKPAESAKKPETSAAGPDRGTAAAARLLGLLGRQPEDLSPAIAGTSFTEAGVARLLAHLATRRTRRGGAWLRFLKSSQRYLSRPVPAGLRTVEGVGIERLQTFTRQLEDIASGGWARFRAARTARRHRLAPAGPLVADQGEPTPAKARQKGAKH